MNVFVITACYNYEGKLEKYVESFLKSYVLTKELQPEYLNNLNIRFIFVNDQPGTSKLIREITKPLTRFKGLNVSIHDNVENIGATRSRNYAARAIFMRGLVQSGDDLIMYFDSDDIWDRDAVKIISSLRNCPNDFIFLPVDVSTIPINKELKGEIELGKFATYIPLQESIYVWKASYALDFLRKFGFLWYEDNSDSKYFPEDLMFYLNPKHKCFINPDLVICHRDYSTGNIAHDWEATIKKNKSAFKMLVRAHRINMHRYDYPAELIKYVNWVDGLVTDPKPETKVETEEVKE
jgi:glycosyltransferase involved in cell wall biosynthesis